MELTAVSLVLFSAFIHSIWNLIVKKSRDKVVFVWLRSVFMVAFFLPVFAYLLYRGAVVHLAWYVVFASAVTHLAYNVLLSRTYELGDISLTYPIVRSYPVFVVVPAFFVFGESVSLPAAAGIVLVLSGVYTINLKSLSFSEFIRPFTHLRDPAILYALLAAFSSTAYSILDKMGVVDGSPFIFFYVMTAVQLFFYTLSVMALRKPGDVRAEWRLNKWSVAACGFLTFLSYLIMLYVFRTDKVAYVVSLRQVSIVFGVLWGSLLLKESYGRIRFIAAALIFAGAYLIGVSS